MTMCVRCVCRCIAASRHATLTCFRHLLVGQMRPSCTQPSRPSLSQGQGCALHVVHYNDITHSERTVHVTSQVGQNNSFPWHTDHGTFYKVCRGQTAPVHSPDPASRIRTNRQGTSGSQPWPCANPQLVLSPSDTSPSLTTRRARGDRIPLRPVSKGPDQRVPSPRLPPLSLRI